MFLSGRQRIATVSDGVMVSRSPDDCVDEPTIWFSVKGVGTEIVIISVKERSN